MSGKSGINFHKQVVEISRNVSLYSVCPYYLPSVLHLCLILSGLYIDRITGMELLKPALNWFCPRRTY